MGCSVRVSELQSGAIHPHGSGCSALPLLVLHFAKFVAHNTNAQRKGQSIPMDRGAHTTPNPPALGGFCQLRQLFIAPPVTVTRRPMIRSTLDTHPRLSSHWFPTSASTEPTQYRLYGSFCSNLFGFHILVGLLLFVFFIVRGRAAATKIMIS